jgi:hypothetical protein
MNSRIKQDKVERVKTDTSMSIASKPICKDDECIGKLNVSSNENDTEHDNNTEENRKRTTRSSMNFGNKGSCSNEECIGKT